MSQLVLFFSEKNFHKQSITLKEKGETITDNKKCIFNRYISPFVYNNFNISLFSSWFPFLLQMQRNANFTQVFKKK